MTKKGQISSVPTAAGHPAPHTAERPPAGYCRRRWAAESRRTARIAPAPEGRRRGTAPPERHIPFRFPPSPPTGPPASKLKEMIKVCSAIHSDNHDQSGQYPLRKAVKLSHRIHLPRDDRQIRRRRPDLSRHFPPKRPPNPSVPGRTSTVWNRRRGETERQLASLFSR